MAEEMSRRELVCSGGPQVKEVGLKNGKHRSVDFVPFKEDISTARAFGSALGRRL